MTALPNLSVDDIFILLYFLICLWFGGWFSNNILQLKSSNREQVSSSLSYLRWCFTSMTISKSAASNPICLVPCFPFRRLLSSMRPCSMSMRAISSLTSMQISCTHFKIPIGAFLSTKCVSGGRADNNLPVPVHRSGQLCGPWGVTAVGLVHIDTPHSHRRSSPVMTTLKIYVQLSLEKANSHLHDWRNAVFLRSGFLHVFCHLQQIRQGGPAEMGFDELSQIPENGARNRPVSITRISPSSLPSCSNSIFKSESLLRSEPTLSSFDF